MPPAPTVAAIEVDRAIATLNELGGDHAAMVENWQSGGANPAEELGYAKQAFAKYATTSVSLIAVGKEMILKLFWLLPG
jgi:hypothetical protein